MTSDSPTHRTGTVAVGFDGSPHARDALALGADLARISGARLAVVVVFAVDFLVDLDREELREPLRRDAEAKLDGVPADLLEGLEVELHTAVARSDARGLHNAAEELGADVLVVGASHRSAVGQVLLGSVGTRLLHGAPCAVAVAPAGYASSQARGIHVVAAAFDGSPESRAAVAEAAEIAAAANAALRIVAVAGGTSVGSAVAIAWATYDMMLAEDKKFLQGELEALRDALPPSLHTDTRLLTGNPAALIRQEAEKGADLLVLGSRGYGAVRRAMLGSVSAELLRSAPCSVLVTPRGSHERAAAEAAEALAPS